MNGSKKSLSFVLNSVDARLLNAHNCLQEALDKLGEEHSVYMPMLFVLDNEIESIRAVIEHTEENVDGEVEVAA